MHWFHPLTERGVTYDFSRPLNTSPGPFPNALAVKATIVRPRPSGALGERDVYGAQQHAPLMNFSFEWNG